MNLFSLQTEKRAAEINQLSRINNSKNHFLALLMHFDDLRGMRI